MVLIVCKRRIRVDRAVLCFLDIVHGGSVSLEVLQARLDSVFDLSAPGPRYTMVGVDTLGLLLQGAIEESDIDSIAGLSTRVRRSEGDMAFRVPILRCSDEGPLMIVKQIVDFW